MAQEIYHRSEWGNPTETWGNVYLNADLTNELYKRASEYENSWVTDQLLNGVGIKPSIILTPTAYEDGVLNSVKPQRTYGSELVTNGDFSDGTNNWTAVSAVISASNNILTVDDSANAGGDSRAVQSFTTNVGVTYKVRFNRISTTSSFYLGIGGGIGYNNIFYANLGTDLGIYERTFIATDTTSTIALITSGTGITKFSEVSVKEVTEADFDFTRGSSATRVNEQGLVEDVQILSGELVQNGDFEQIGSEQVVNGGFDTDSDWTKGSGWSIADGKAIYTGTTNSDLAQSGILTSGKLYKLQYEVINSTLVNGVVKLSGTTASAQNVLSQTVGTHTLYFTADGTMPTSFNIRIVLNTSGQFELDNVSVKEVGQNWTVTNDDANNYVEFNQDEGTVRLKFLNTSPLTTLSSDTQYLSGNKYKLIVDVKEVVSGGIKIDAAGVSELFNSVGVQERIIEPTGNAFISFYRATADVDITLNSVSLIEVTDDTDLPRINYTDGEGSLLLEPSRTNVLLHSNSLDQWATSTSIDVTSNQIGVGGSNDAWLINRTDTGARYVQASSTVSGTQVLSFYAKANTTDWIWVFNGTNSCYLDIANGVEGTSVGFSDIKFKLMDNSWYRISLKANNTTTYTRFYPSRTNGAVSGNTDLSFYLQYCGLEQGSYATSYIPTNGSTVTRLADVCNNSGNSDLINSTEGVLYAEISALANDGTNRTIALNKDSNDRIQMYFDTADNSLSIFYKAQGTHTFGMNETLTDATEFNKIAFKWKTNDFALWVNGTETDTVSSGVTSNANTLNALEFEMFNNFASFYGNVKCVAVFKEALSDTELEKLTTI